LLNYIGELFCPICGADWRNLKWTCHNLNLQEAQALAAERFQNVVGKRIGGKKRNED
jgi:hypothetical protein